MNDKEPFMPIFRSSGRIVALLLLLMIAGCMQQASQPTATPLPPPTVAPTTAASATLAPTVAPTATLAEATAAPVTPTDAAAAIVPNALPFTLEFVPQTFSGALPTLQSYTIATTQQNLWLLVGGRTQGLHTFQETADNFPPLSANNNMWVIDPGSGQFWQFDVNKLPPEKAAPLQATNQQSYHDPVTDQLYIIGGYGWKADQSDMITFNTIIRFPVAEMVAALQADPQEVERIDALIEIASDDRFAVTGGELAKLGDQFYLAYGQKFMGQYRAFSGGGQAPFTQEYTEEIRVFTLFPNTLEINAYGPLTNGDPDQPFHRRDGNVVEDIDPNLGVPRLSAYGGVFKPGQIAAYTEPIYLNAEGIAEVDRSLEQRFSQYECPVIPIYDDANKMMYNTFFGGISHSYYFQTPAQQQAYEQVTQEGRNDGFPFIADITVLVQDSAGQYSQYIMPQPIPDNQLLGTSVPFILNPALMGSDSVYENGTIRLSSLQPGQRLLIGYIYGGILAQNPLPLQPNSGTSASNALFEVYLTNAASGAIPGDEGKVAEVNDANLGR
jgi:hypothetical protein